ncbi:hypothetical protein [Aliiglaciecola sp. LCG003]|uniref:hypothetical protein n=1 Tax=Aliiglaciecola sp. LCG003 TaxID=3053655 RepID=UPI002573DFAD|nr:hypothetical protein [Aliiglaciecola sp. LCG003]WJG09287.1 hypothetical protein QR722_18460 [Aliiglaciecola sp. LCG003]
MKKSIALFLLMTPIGFSLTGCTAIGFVADVALNEAIGAYDEEDDPHFYEAPEYNFTAEGLKYDKQLLLERKQQLESNPKENSATDKPQQIQR